MRIVFMGTPEFATTPLEHLLLNRYDVVAVYTQPDRLAGRGRHLVTPPVKILAETWRLPVLQPSRLGEAAVVAELAGYSPDVVVVAAFGQVLPQAVLDLPRHGCINIHPSLLPRYRGASPVTSAILAGEEFTGVSIMLMDSGLDTGPVLSRAQVAIGAGDTTGSLEGKLAGISAGLLQEVLERWPRGEIIPRPQDEAGASYCSVVTREQGEIDWSLPAVDIERRVRAFQPWPGCYTTWRGRRLKVLEAVPLPEAAPVGVGQVVALPPVAGGAGVAFGIGSGRGVLGIRRLQMEGKRPVSAAEFLHGQRQFIGAGLTGDP